MLRARLARAWQLFERRLYVSAQTEREVIDAFHRLYHQRGKIDGSAWWSPSKMTSAWVSGGYVPGMVESPCTNVTPVARVSGGFGGTRSIVHTRGAPASR